MFPTMMFRIPFTTLLSPLALAGGASLLGAACSRIDSSPTLPTPERPWPTWLKISIGLLVFAAPSIFIYKFSRRNPGKLLDLLDKISPSREAVATVVQEVPKGGAVTTAQSLIQGAGDPRRMTAEGWRVLRQAAREAGEVDAVVASGAIPPPRRLTPIPVITPKLTAAAPLPVGDPTHPVARRRGFRRIAPSPPEIHFSSDGNWNLDRTQQLPLLPARYRLTDAPDIDTATYFEKTPNPRFLVDFSPLDLPGGHGQSFGIHKFSLSEGGIVSAMEYARNCAHAAEGHYWGLRYDLRLKIILNNLETLLRELQHQIQKG